MSTRSEKFRDGSETFTVTGSSGNEYHISKNSSAARERGTEWSCECMAFVIQKKFPCKHMTGPKFSKSTERLVEHNITQNQRERAVGLTPAQQVERGLTAEQRTAEERVRREAVEAKKTQKLAQNRYGFQLAHIYQASDFVEGQMVAEIKYDGELGMIVDNQIINRSGNNVTKRFPEIEKTDKAVLVGEVCVLESNGLSNFSKVQQRGTDDPLKISVRSKSLPAKFIAFDIIELAGVDLTSRPFSERREKLEAFISKANLKNVELIEQIELSKPSDVTKLVEKMAELGGEGFMIKNLTSSYRAGRGRRWVKAKTWTDDEFTILRFESTGIGHGFVFYVMSGTHEQRVVCNSIEMEAKIRAGHKKVEVKYLSKGEDGALRFPSLRRLI